MQADHVFFGLHITDRVQNALEIQKVLTEYGCNIKTRLGLHETGPNHCSPSGLVLLEVTGDDETVEAFYNALAAVKGIQIQRMSFNHG